MTRYAESKFTVGPNSASAAKAFRDNYDAVFGKKPAPDPLRSLSDEEYAKLEPLAEEALQAALDQGRDDADRVRCKPFNPANKDHGDAFRDGYVDDDGVFRQG